VAIVAGQTTVNSSAAVLIHQTDADGCDIILAADIGAGQHVCLSPVGVTTSTGYIFDGGRDLHYKMPPGSVLYGIANSGTCTVSKLVSD
jgi:hypothetical protein